MGLVVETIKDMFNFVLKYPKSFLFSFIINLFIFIGAMAMAGGVLISIGPALETATQSSLVPGVSSFLLMNVPRLAGAVVFAIIGFIIILIAGLVRSGGFPILVYQAAKRHKLDLASIFQTTLRKLSKIFVANLISGIIVLLPLVPAFILIFGSISGISSLNFTPFIFAIVLALVFFVIAAFLGIRLWLTIPILMIENRGAMDSVKASWERTEGQLVSIIGVSILYALVVGLPLAAINALLNLAGVYVYSAWTLIEGIITATLSGVLPVIYYFNSRSMRRR
jgi:hypothetical protein